MNPLPAGSAILGRVSDAFRDLLGLFEEAAHNDIFWAGDLLGLCLDPVRLEVTGSCFARLPDNPLQ